MKTHVMRKLCADVFICPVCFHMVRNTPLEDRKFTVMVEGESNIVHTIPEEPEVWPTLVILERLNHLVGELKENQETYLDRKIPSSSLENCIFLTEPIAIYNN